MKRTFDGDSEAETGTLAKAIYDVTTGKTVIALSICRYGRDVLCVVVYDDV
jgi:hypothetical protein